MSFKDAPSQLKILQTRVYYDQDSGEIVHVHQLAVDPNDDLDDERIDEEMAAFEMSIAGRHGGTLEHIRVDSAAFEQVPHHQSSYRVDPATQRLLRDGAEA